MAHMCPRHTVLREVRRAKLSRTFRDAPPRVAASSLNVRDVAGVPREDLKQQRQVTAEGGEEEGVCQVLSGRK